MPTATVTKGTDLILHVFPENIAKAIYEGQVLQIVVFSIIFGIAVAMIKDKYKTPMIRFTEALAETMFKFTQLIMYFAPFAVFAAIALQRPSSPAGKANLIHRRQQKRSRFYSPDSALSYQ